MMSLILADKQVQINRADSLSFSALHSGGAVALSAASFTFYRGTEIMLTGNGTAVGNVVTISIPANTFDLAGQYRLVLNVTRSTGGAVLTTQHLIWAVYHKLVPMVDDAVLLKYAPTIGDDVPEGETNWQDQIDQAFDDVLDDLGRRGYDGSVVVDAGQLNKLVTFKALAIIFWGMTRSPDDGWRMKYEDAKAEYDRTLGSIVLDISEDRSGVPTTKTQFATTRMVR